MRCHAKIIVLFCRTGIQSVWKKSVAVWKQMSKWLVQCVDKVDLDAVLEEEMLLYR